MKITTIITIQINNYRATQLYNYITIWKIIKLQHAILEALYIRDIKPGLNKQDELRDHKLIIKVFPILFWPIRDQKFRETLTRNFW